MNTFFNPANFLRPRKTIGVSLVKYLHVFMILVFMIKYNILANFLLVHYFVPFKPSTLI